MLMIYRQVLLVLLASVPLILALETGVCELRTPAPSTPPNQRLGQSSVLPIWNMTEIESLPLNTYFGQVESYYYTPSQIGNFTYPPANLTQQECYYSSEWWNGSDVRVYGVLVTPDGLIYPPPWPGLVMVHGYNGTHNDALPLAKWFAYFGIATFSLDIAGSPGGNSGGPPTTPSNLFNVTPGDLSSCRQSAFYHGAVSVFRAISLLTSLPFVNSSRLALFGASYGGMLTFIVNALDNRLSCAIPVLAAGDLTEAIHYGGLFNLLVPHFAAGADDARVVLTIRAFDPIVYAEHALSPTLMIIGTNDEYFPLSGIVETYHALPETPGKAIQLVPGIHHQMLEGNEKTALRWIRHCFEPDNAKWSIPHFSTTSKTIPGLVDNLVVGVTVSSASPERVMIHFREEWLVNSWKGFDLSEEGGEWSGAFSAPLLSTTASYLVTVILPDDSKFSTITTTIYMRNVFSYYVFEALYTLVLGAVFVRVFINLRKVPELRPEDHWGVTRMVVAPLSKVLLGFLGSVLLLFTTFLPWITISGRVGWNLWQIVTFVFDNQLFSMLVLAIFYVGVLLAAVYPKVGGLTYLSLPGLIGLFVVVTILGGTSKLSTELSIGFFLPLAVSALLFLLDTGLDWGLWKLGEMSRTRAPGPVEALLSGASSVHVSTRASRSDREKRKGGRRRQY